jgi:hypothetical protein
MFLSTADLSPMPRDKMRQLRAKQEELRRQEEEARRRAHVTSVAREVYQRAVTMAGLTDRTYYTYSLPFAGAELAEDIMRELRGLFPDCDVSCVEDTVVREGVRIIVDWA